MHNRHLELFVLTCTDTIQFLIVIIIHLFLRNYIFSASCISPKRYGNCSSLLIIFHVVVIGCAWMATHCLGDENPKGKNEQIL